MAHARMNGGECIYQTMISNHLTPRSIESRQVSAHSVVGVDEQHIHSEEIVGIVSATISLVRHWLPDCTRQSSVRGLNCRVARRIIEIVLVRVRSPILHRRKRIYKFKI